MSRALLLVALAVISGCAQPLHLQYDFGRAYTQTFRVQADLTRATAANQSYSLYGPEAAAIRLNVQAMTADEKSGDSTIDK